MQEHRILVEDVIRDTMLMLERQGYKIHNTRKYHTVYRGLAQYCQTNNNGEYSHEIGEAFIQSLREREIPLSVGFFRTYVCAVERANHVLEGEDNWYPRTKLLEYADSVFIKETKLYEEYLRNSGKTKSDVRSRMHTVARFLRFVDLTGVTKLSALTARNIYGAFQEASDKGGFHKCVSGFLKYAHRHALTEQDFSALVPSVTRHVPVPTVYSPEELEKIIETSAQSKVCERRNKAIVVIAARLGLRSCDIANLRFENICRDRQTIEITQVKTKEPLTLPLLPEIRDALDDYIENERTESNSDYIFQYGRFPIGEPIQPYTIYTIVSRIIDSSGVDVKGRRRGAHVLRSSLATGLLNEGYSHHEVQDALGHKSPEAVKFYIKTEVEHLRKYALPVPKPTRVFAASLRLGVNV